MAQTKKQYYRVLANKNLAETTEWTMHLTRKELTEQLDAISEAGFNNVTCLNITKEI